MGVQMSLVEFEGALIPENPAWVSPALRLPLSRVLSANDRLNRGQAAKKVAFIRGQAMLLARAGRAPRFERAEVKVIVRFPDGRRRDPNNYHATTKPLIDGFVDAGVFPDDDAKHVLGPDIRKSSKRAEPSLSSPMCDFIVMIYPF